MHMAHKINEIPLHTLAALTSIRTLTKSRPISKPQKVFKPPHTTARPLNRGSTGPAGRFGVDSSLYRKHKLKYALFNRCKSYRGESSIESEDPILPTS